MIKSLDLYDPWAAAYAISTGAQLVTILPGEFVRYVFDDSNGQASRALGEWRQGRAMVAAKVFASAYRHVRRLAR